MKSVHAYDFYYLYSTLHNIIKKQIHNYRLQHKTTNFLRKTKKCKKFFFNKS